MKTFREFILLEKQRSLDQAAKLGSYLATRHSKGSLPRISYDEKGHETITPKRLIKFKRPIDNIYRNQEESEEGISTVERRHGDLTRSAFDKIPPTKLPLHNLRATQYSTSFRPEYYKDVKSKDERPIYVIKHKNRNYILDGHHRFLDHKLRGETHINAHVINSDD